jgi:hypothetical protein
MNTDRLCRVTLIVLVALCAVCESQEVVFPQAIAAGPLEGVVLAPDETPVAGAEVQVIVLVAGPYRPRRGTPIIGTSVLPPPGKEEQTTRSDEQGRFHFDSIPCGARVIATGTTGDRAVARFGCSVEPIQLHLRPTVQLHGAITDALGLAAPDASLRASWPADGLPLDWRKATSEEDGSFAFEDIFPGAWKVTARVEPLQWLEVEVVVPETGPIDKIELSFPLTGSVSGRVAGLSAVEIGDIELLIDGDRCGVQLSHNGRFRIDGLPEGTYEISALRRSTEETATPVSVTIMNHGQVVEVDLDFPELIELSGQAHCGGRGAPGLQVELYGPSQRVTTTDDDGEWSVDDVEPGYYSLDFVDSGMKVIARQDANIDQATRLLTEIPCCELTGRVFTPGGFPIPGVTVWIDLLSSGRRMADTTSGDTGSFSFAKLPPARYSLRAGIGDQVSDEVIVDLLDATFAVDITFDVREGLELLIFEPSGEPARRIKVQPMMRQRVLPPLTTDCTEQGLCHVEEMGFGFYELLVTGWYGARSLRVAVPSDVVKVQLLPLGTLEIRLHPDAQDEGHMVRVFSEDGVTMPPASFLEQWVWQPIFGLLTMDVPIGSYKVELRTPDGRSGYARVEVAESQRAGVLIEPDD